MATKSTELRSFTDGATHSLNYGKLPNGTVSAFELDSVTSAQVSISHEFHKIHEGKTFRCGDSITLGSAATEVYLITTPNTAELAHLTFSGDGTAITTFDAFEGSDRVGTTPLTCVNANRNSLTAASMTVHKGVSGGTTDGVQIFKYSSGTSTNQSKSESSLDFGSKWILKRNTKYLLRVTSGTAGNLINIFLNWYEHTSIN